jgi:glycerophosphoryl diester phosphodiesterase
VTAPPAGELEIIAHRGYSALAPENTLAAVEKAIEAGADAIEWDVHLAACGTPVLIHDETLERTTDGAGPVRTQTVEALRRLDAGRWFGPAFAGERIPTLAEALARTGGRVRRVYTEIKADPDPDDVDRILDVVRGAGRLDDNVFISFDWAALDRIAERDPRARVGYITDEMKRVDQALEHAAAVPGAILDLDCRLILKNPDLARRALDRGLDVAVWTVNESSQAARLEQAGVTRFTTNEVEDLLRWRAGAS